MANDVNWARSMVRWVGLSVTALTIGFSIWWESAPDLFHSFLVTWICGCLGYIYWSNTLKDPKCRHSLAKALCSLAAGAVLFSAFAALMYGTPWIDDDGFTISDGFNSTLSDKANAGIRSFARIFIGASLGILLATQLKELEDKKPQ